MNKRASAVLAVLAAEAALRLVWLAGGRWGYTACDRRDLPPDPAGGCGADAVATVPFRAGWGALAVIAVLAALVVWARLRPGRAAAAGLWTAAAVVAVAAFPLHLLFEVPAAVAGRPSDWRDLTARTVLVVLAVLLAALAVAVGPQTARGRAAYHPVAGWARRCGHVAVVLPIVGWAVPHLLWLLDVGFGMSEVELAELQRDLSVPAAVAITVVPPLAGLLTLGLVQRWGQQFPGWMPVVGGRGVPRLLALVPATTVALALVVYGGLSFAELAGGTATWGEAADNWAVTGTLLVFVGWGVTLAATTAGYYLATRPEPVADVRERAAR
ncbi:hypothetical protein [Actinoplanes sp. URMC 104]|uniref:hypothetical protein n=1 Tax=Actinoplanes sp. URMC 104 TaxID=3423409 RepID=UPI003F19D60A